MASSWRWYRNSHFKPTMNASLIPSQLKQSERVLRMIKMSKPKLPRHNWKAAKFENSHISCFAAIIVNQEAMEHLMNFNDMLAFEFGRIILNACKKDNRPLKANNKTHRGNRH